ncbi:MAG: outer membrane beta-barrel protein [Saprospiraceae bacterium]|nr:outer membrane beta-barrel protein [Saprospiraceae bacterium]MBP7679968.1 outer membrane beta-barrel protein [Saprospiraceae bacterium]
MKNNIIIGLLLLLTATCSAQYFEAGIFLGASNYSGDLDPDARARLFRETHFAGGILARYPIGEYINIRGTFSVGTLSGTDANNKEDARKQRNLNFRSSIQEVALLAEWNIFGYDVDNKNFTPYLYAGGALFHFNPRTQYQGEWVALQPLGTEGQGLTQYPDKQKYKLWQFSIPIGGGVKYAISESWNIGLEIGVRKTFTDYIDDISTIYIAYDELAAGNGVLAAQLANRQNEYFGIPEPPTTTTGTVRGSTANKDWYAISGITLTYNFTSDTGLSSGGGHYRSRTRSGCPTF